jgi:CheY-like chemotaxis protein
MIADSRDTPFAPNEGRSRPSQENSQTVWSRPGILVVDDDVNVRTVLVSALWEAGFVVWSASDGNEAIRLYDEQRSHIEIVLLDVRMPGMDGPQTLNALQCQNPRIRCCFMSADTGEYTEEQLLELGAVGIIHKPFRLVEVSQRLKEFLKPGVNQVSLTDAVAEPASIAGTRSQDEKACFRVMTDQWGK